ncbi:UNVERIFIED_CONTAM: hypothetical protein FKN15_039368 [Acipenser sinensis]
MTYLSISNTQLSDSALYYCALGTTVMLIKVQLLTKTFVETLRITPLCAEKPWMFMLMPCLETDLYQSMKTVIPWACFNLVNTRIALPVRWVFINPIYPPSLPPPQYNNCQRDPSYPEEACCERNRLAKQKQNKLQTVDNMSLYYKQRNAAYIILLNIHYQAMIQQGQRQSDRSKSSKKKMLNIKQGHFNEHSSRS